MEARAWVVVHLEEVEELAQVLVRKFKSSTFNKFSIFNPLLPWLRSSFLNATGPSLERRAAVPGAIHRSHLKALLTSSSTRTFPAKTVHIHNVRWRCRRGIVRARTPPTTGATYYYTITKIHLCPRNCRSSCRCFKSVGHP